MDEYLYDAFISYSHRDLKWAQWLQHRLETFALPVDIRASRSNSGKHLRIFRDQTDLAGVELQESLQKAMDHSRCLIVLCTPDSARSKWVGDEIRYFKSMGRSDRIIPFVVAGEPESDQPERECYHEELRNEPDRHLLGANIQELGRNKAFLRLMAILLDIRFDRLVNRDRQRRRRTALIFLVTVVVIMTVVGLLLQSNYEISKQNDELSYDVYGAAILSISQKNVFEPEDVAILRISSEAGNEDAMLYLAYCYENGMGTEQDSAAAFSWFQKSAEKNNAAAMAALSNCYGNGIGVEQDPKQSFEWALRAAEAGNPSGMLYVGYYYESGFGVQKDLEKALEYFLQAAEAGHEEAIYNVAVCYRIGNGTEVDEEKAFFWTKKLAEKNNPSGMYNLALMYEYGWGTPEDPQLAYSWYKRAAETGDPDAMFKTGWCIENRYGIEDAALEWYQMAAELGNDSAVEAVKRMKSQLPGQTDVPDDHK